MWGRKARVRVGWASIFYIKTLIHHNHGSRIKESSWIRSLLIRTELRHSLCRTGAANISLITWLYVNAQLPVASNPPDTRCCRHTKSLENPLGGREGLNIFQSDNKKTPKNNYLLSWRHPPILSAERAGTRSCPWVRWTCPRPGGRRRLPGPEETNTWSHEKELEWFKIIIIIIPTSDFMQHEWPNRRWTIMPTCDEKHVEARLICTEAITEYFN